MRNLFKLLNTFKDGRHYSAIESSHAVAAARKIAPTMAKDKILVINLSGRGDKDVYQIARYRGLISMNRIDVKLEQLKETKKRH